VICAELGYADGFETHMHCQPPTPAAQLGGRYTTQGRFEAEKAAATAAAACPLCRVNSEVLETCRHITLTSGS